MIFEFPVRDPQRLALGRRLRTAREARGCSLETLSAAMRISPGKLHRAEDGRERLSGSELYGAILELHLPMDLLFTSREGAPGA